MKNFSTTIDKQLIDKIYSKYKSYLCPNGNKYILYFFKLNNLTISIYTSNKILINGSYNYIDEFLSEFNINKSNYYFNEEFEYEIGSDETGVGDFFGGLVVCSTKISKKDFQYLNEKYNIKDSKKMTDTQIINLYKELINIVEYQIYSFTPIEYNEFIKNNNFNTNHVKTYLHNLCLNHFNHNNSIIIIDQFASKTNYIRYLNDLKTKNFVIPNVFETKAELKYLSVAIAAIIARGWYLIQMNNLSNKIGIQLPLGSWNEKIKKVANIIIKNYGRDFLNKISKNEFKVDLS